MNAPIHIVKGADPVLVVDRLAAVVDELVGERDRTEAVDELAGDDYATLAEAAESFSNIVYEQADSLQPAVVGLWSSGRLCRTVELRC